MGSQGLQERLRVFDNCSRNNNTLDPLQQRSEDLPDCVHKAQGSLLAADLPRSEGIAAPHPIEAIESSAMSSQYAFGCPRRARSVEQVGGIFSTDERR